MEEFDEETEFFRILEIFLKNHNNQKLKIMNYNYIICYSVTIDRQFIQCHIHVSERMHTELAGERSEEARGNVTL